MQASAIEHGSVATPIVRPWGAVEHARRAERERHSNQSVYVPLRAIDRLTNRTDRPLALIEVRCGDHVGEDDIERFDDVCGRI